MEKTCHEVSVYIYLFPPSSLTSVQSVPTGSNDYKGEGKFLNQLSRLFVYVKPIEKLKPLSNMYRGVPSELELRVPGIDQRSIP